MRRPTVVVGPAGATPGGAGADDGSLSAELDPALRGGITDGEGIQRDHDHPNLPVELAQSAFEEDGHSAGLATVGQDQIRHLQEAERPTRGRDAWGKGPPSDAHVVAGKPGQETVDGPGLS